MAIYEISTDRFRKIDESSFSNAGLRERQDLQRLLRDQIDVISPNTLVIAEEFGQWEECNRRIDLLGVDAEANLVVIELKRTEDNLPEKKPAIASSVNWEGARGGALLQIGIRITYHLFTARLSSM